MGTIAGGKTCFRMLAEARKSRRLPPTIAALVNDTMNKLGVASGFRDELAKRLAHAAEIKAGPLQVAEVVGIVEPITVVGLSPVDKLLTE